MFRTLCNPDIFRTLLYSGVFGILSSICDETSFEEPCVNLAFLKPWYILNLRNISNLAKIYNIMWRLLDELSYIQNPSTFRTLAYLKTVVYSEPCQVYTMKYFSHVTLCNYNIFRLLIHLKSSIFTTKDIQIP